MTNDHKKCSRCNEVAPATSRFCRQCGHTTFEDVSPESVAVLEGLKTQPEVSLRLDSNRLIIASILSGGLYIFYWLYITWKQLAKETNDQHFPVWHALTWAVPFYQLFRLHRHATVIQGLATKAGVPTTLSAGTVVALGLAAFGLGMATFYTINAGLAFLLGTIVMALTTTIIVWNQGALNAYWVTQYGEKLHTAPIERAEGIIVLFGILVWISTLVG